MAAASLSIICTEASDTTSVNASGESGHWQEPQPRGVLVLDEFSIYWSLGKVFLPKVCDTFLAPVSGEELSYAVSSLSNGNGSM